MSSYIIIIDEDEIVLKACPAEGPSLEDLQHIVKGYIQTVPVCSEIRKSAAGTAPLMIVNEEGKLNGLPVNLSATAACGHDIIVGPAAILNATEENMQGFSREQLPLISFGMEKALKTLFEGAKICGLAEEK